MTAENDADLRGGTLDLADDVERHRREERAGERVIVTQTPAGPIVEGTAGRSPDRRSGRRARRRSDGRCPDG